MHLLSSRSSIFLCFFTMSRYTSLELKVGAQPLLSLCRLPSPTPFPAQHLIEPVDLLPRGSLFSSLHLSLEDTRLLGHPYSNSISFLSSSKLFLIFQMHQAIL